MILTREGGRLLRRNLRQLFQKVCKNHFFEEKSNMDEVCCSHTRNNTKRFHFLRRNNLIKNEFRKFRKCILKYSKSNAFFGTSLYNINNQNIFAYFSHLLRGCRNLYKQLSRSILFLQSKSSPTNSLRSVLCLTMIPNFTSIIHCLRKLFAKDRVQNPTVKTELGPSTIRVEASFCVEKNNIAGVGACATV